MEFELIAKTFMGLEPVLAQELTQLSAAVWYHSPVTRK